NFHLVRPVLDGLREKSRIRLAADPGFRLVRQELAMADENENAHSISLNETVRRREKTRFQEIDAEMKKVLLADAARTPPSYEITLATLDSAGLPPARQPAQAGTAASNPAENEPDEDIELRETENILADYIHALSARPAQAMVAGARPELGPALR